MLLESLTSRKSLMNVKNSKIPKWGTPDVTLMYFEVVLLKITFCLQCIKYVLIQFQFNLISNTFQIQFKFNVLVKVNCGSTCQMHN